MAQSNRTTIVTATEMTKLTKLFALLSRHYGELAGPPTTDPFELVLWENVAYLASPERRREAFEDLKAHVGTTSDEILHARKSALERVTAKGILKSTFAAKLRDCARILQQEFAGDLSQAVRLPLQEAKRALRKFPGIGEPGAEKILLFAKLRPLLAPDSNALRVLVRLGLIAEEASYARMYAASREVERALPAESAAMIQAHLLLQHHGQQLCKRSTPRCAQCPLRQQCPASSA
jgi:endonuclease-3